MLFNTDETRREKTRFRHLHTMKLGAAALSAASAIATAADGTQTTLTVSTDPAIGEESVEHTLTTELYQPPVAGPISLLWIKEAGGQRDTDIDRYFAAWTDVYGEIRSQRLLNKTETELPDADIDPILADVSGDILSENPCLGSYGDLTESEARIFDRAMALRAVAEWRPRLLAAANGGQGPVIEKEVGPVRTRWAQTGGGQVAAASGKTVDADLMAQYYSVLGQIPCVQAANIARAAGRPPMFIATGPTRSMEERGCRPWRCW